MGTTVSSLFLARSAEEEEEATNLLLIVNYFWVFLLWINGEVSPYLLFLKNGLSFFPSAK
ncbi:unnamed protein product [Malus baccata var. baccata]